MTFPLRMQVVLAVLIGLSQSAYADALPASTMVKGDPVVDVRGQDSIVESIDMSPQATAFWRSIRKVINTIDLNDYEKVASELSLESTYRRPLQHPMQFSYPSLLQLREAVLVTTYRVRPTGSATRWTFSPDPRFLCLSRREVEQSFGPGENDSRVPPQVVDAGYGGAFETATSRLGYFHAMRYQVGGLKRYVEVLFSPGGCADAIGLMQINTDEFGLPEPSNVVPIE
ncbi:hypothetical protein [Ralstonia sp. A12]|uniref:hypothetical protein n=1 Tax=Ralstonia sp. A12 TaxID=1217052 RepID=UPI000A07505E|nr:hypothetical protein [Ralstonia sp. A12]